MTEKKYIDISQIKLAGKTLYDEENGDLMISVEDVRRAILQTPAADVREVVTCEKCIFWDNGRCEGLQNGLMRDYTKPWDYCSNGERKDGGTI